MEVFKIIAMYKHFNMKVFLLWATILSLSGGGSWAWTQRESRHVTPPSTFPPPTFPPVFEFKIPANITVTAAKAALLSCVVYNLGNNSVSWIRHRDLHILSVGATTYTSDSRFEAVPQSSTGDWALRLRYAHPRDSGQYDCQVSSTPPQARTVHLTVVEPQAMILRAPEMHVGVGSLINLTCVVPYAPEAPEYLHWYHKEQMVREESWRVSIKTQLDRRSISQLVIRQAKPSDAGVYTCNPDHSREHSITVHVLTEYPAAMQGGSSVIVPGRRLWATLLSATITIVFTLPV